MNFRGKVKQGQKRGKDLGFPTANLNLNKTIDEGIYISLVKLKNKQHPSLTFIGKAITFNENLLQAEVYILDFNQNIYNQWLSVKLLKKIRGNKKFEMVEELVKEMKEDLKQAKEYFKNV